MTAPSLDALARLAAAAAEHVAALDSACVHPIRPSAAWRCGWCDGCAARADALEALRTAAPDLARGLVAAVDALLAADRERHAAEVAGAGARAAALREAADACRSVQGAHPFDDAAEAWCNACEDAVAALVAAPGEGRA